MSRKIICTVGTSIARSAAPGPRVETSADIARNLEHWAKECNADPHGFLVNACAETHSLWRFGPRPDDEVVLLATDTEEGKACAAAVQELVEKHLQVLCQTVTVRGLQVDDAQRFRREGIQHLFDVIDKQAQGGPAVLNVTGGFKSVVPFVTLYGLIKQIPVIYIFERSQQLIELPPAPVSFDYERLSQARQALQELEREDVMSKERFFELIPGLPYHERGWFESLIEDDGQQVIPSAFGLMLMRELGARRAGIFLSPKALRSLEASEGAVREQFLFMLARVPDPLWRSMKAHAISGGDLPVYKPGNTAERMAAFVRGDTVYVCELWASHDEYNRVVGSCRVSDYPTNGFRPWTDAVAETDAPGVDLSLMERRLAEQQSQITRNAEKYEGLRRSSGAQRKKAKALEELVGEALVREQALLEERACLRERMDLLERVWRLQRDDAMHLRSQLRELSLRGIGRDASSPAPNRPGGSVAGATQDG